MDVSVDELAGIVDLFGGLSRAELDRALMDVAARDGVSVDEDVVEETIAAARETFALVRYTPPAPAALSSAAPAPTDPEPLLVMGPTAFPSLPDHAEDLPSILDIDPRTPDREAVGVQFQRRFRQAVTDVLERGDGERARQLLDSSYDIEAWAPADLDTERDRLDTLLE